MIVTNVNKQADEIPPRNGSAFSMEVEVPRLLGTDITWALIGTKRNWLKQKFYQFLGKFPKNVPRKWNSLSNELCKILVKNPRKARKLVYTNTPQGSEKF